MTTTAEKVDDKIASDKATAPAAPDKRKALGRGLESLLGGPRPVAAPSAPGPNSIVVDQISAQVDPRMPGEAVLQISVADIDPNPYQTRRITADTETDEGGNSLGELAESIRVNGVIQPITVRLGRDGRYVLITGERRWRASKLAGKATVPAILRPVSDQKAAEMTVIENLQRQDLNCMDQAQAFLMLSQQFKLTQEDIGARVGVSRETISNYIRLTRLPGSVQLHLQKEELEFSHARVLLNLIEPSYAEKVAEKAVREKLSVEQLEDLVAKLNLPLQDEKKEAGKGRWVDPNVRAAQRQMEEVLGMRVRIRDRKGKGKITIEYGSLEDFDRVVSMLKGK